MPDTPDRDAIRRRLEAIAPAPWTVTDNNAGYGPRPLWLIENGVQDDPEGTELAFEAQVNIGHKEDADFIAHAPSDIAALLAYTERLEKAVEMITPVLVAAWRHTDWLCMGSVCCDDECLADRIARALKAMGYNKPLVPMTEDDV